MIFMVTELGPNYTNDTVGVVVAEDFGEVAIKLGIKMEVKCVPGKNFVIGYAEKATENDPLYIITVAEELKSLPNRQELTDAFHETPISYARIREGFLQNVRKVGISEKDAIAFFDMNSTDMKNNVSR